MALCQKKRAYRETQSYLKAMIYMVFSDLILWRTVFDTVKGFFEGKQALAYNAYHI